MSQIPPQVPPQPPYAPPAPFPAQATGPYPAQSLNYAPPPVGVDLRTIAVRQRAIMYCILGYIAMVVAQFVVPPQLQIVPALFAIAMSLTAAVFVFMLALSLYNTAVGIILGILTLIPLIGMFVLLVINGKATTVLRRHGIKVGLMGANARQIPAAGTVQVPRG